MRTRYLTAHWTQAVLLLGLMSVGITAATTAQAGLRLFTAEWSVKAFGNECGGMGTTGPHCTRTTGHWAKYSNWALPQGIKCNPYNPRCPSVSTPTDGKGAFSPLGGGLFTGLYCTPYTIFNAGPRPAKGQTATDGPPPTGMSRPVPPLYRNPAFFDSLGNPKSTVCSATSTGFTTQNKTRFGKNRGKAQQGNPVAGTWGASTTGTPGMGGFSFAAAPASNHPFGLRTTGQVGQFEQLFTYLYSYTYATLRNDQGFFGPDQGPGSFNITYKVGMSTVATINVKQGAAKFGGTMRMLGALKNKACFYYHGGCSLGVNNWRYDEIGASGVMRTAYPSGVITQGFITTYTAYYYKSVPKLSSTITIEGSRFPWTTGSVTVAATGRGPGNTVQYAHGYDNRNTTTPSGLGTIQLVSPVLTRWFNAAADWETGGIAILRIKFTDSLTDSDSDGVGDPLDNCSGDVNTAQDDTDGDSCGNLCDTDYDNDGVVGFLDAFEFGAAFGTNDQEKCHFEPIPGGSPIPNCVVGLDDFGVFIVTAQSAPGPSGTTAGTTACP